MDETKIKQTKRCSKCGEVKALGMFHKRGDAIGGVRSACKRCCRRTAAQKQKRAMDLAESPESNIRSGMVQRCHNPNNPGYKYYGGRGISVCRRWRNSTSAFIEDMGRRPTPEHTVERIDNNGNYSSSNCRWATQAEQNRNTRRNIFITIDGVTKCVAEWARAHGIDPKAARCRLRRGWLPIRAVTEPLIVPRTRQAS